MHIDGVTGGALIGRLGGGCQSSTHVVDLCGERAGKWIIPADAGMISEEERRDDCDRNTRAQRTQNRKVQNPSAARRPPRREVRTRARGGSPRGARGHPSRRASGYTGHRPQYGPTSGFPNSLRLMSSQQYKSQHTMG